MYQVCKVIHGRGSKSKGRLREWPFLDKIFFISLHSILIAVLVAQWKFSRG